ncbi:unnamed protein product [Hymenolepis diminuta]|uniref:Uncharacterized protein n=1 Tax=Hymenolepis diminuta TaxID=6216 RepID=A0A0R3S7W1_HYMDI|nr:unnamed protein product [Hymenolepis diminuta]
MSPDQSGGGSFMKQFFNVKETADELDLKKENAELKTKVENLEKVIEDLKEKLNLSKENAIDSAEGENFVQHSS